MLVAVQLSVWNRHRLNTQFNLNLCYRHRHRPRYSVGHGVGFRHARFESKVMSDCGNILSFNDNGSLMIVLVFLNELEYLIFNGF